jgi:hypothetical protein
MSALTVPGENWRMDCKKRKGNMFDQQKEEVGENAERQMVRALRSLAFWFYPEKQSWKKIHKRFL